LTFLPSLTVLIEPCRALPRKCLFVYFGSALPLLLFHSIIGQMILFIVVVRSISEPKCNFSLAINPSLNAGRSFSEYQQILSANECVFLNATGRNSRFSYWIGTSSKSVRIERYHCEPNKPQCSLASYGETPEFQFYEKVRHAWLKYYFTALSNDTVFSITYGDLLDLRCQRVIVDTTNPWTFVVDREHRVMNRTCLLPCFPNSKTVELIQDGNNGTAVIHHCQKDGKWLLTNLTKLNRTVDHESPIVVVIDPRKDLEMTNVTIRISSVAIPVQKHTILEYPSEGRLLPPVVQSTLWNDLVSLIGTAVIGILLQTFVGFLFWMEYQRAENEVPSIGATASSETMHN
jgi:hypothetical protein